MRHGERVGGLVDGKVSALQLPRPTWARVRPCRETQRGQVAPYPFATPCVLHGYDCGPLTERTAWERTRWTLKGKCVYELACGPAAAEIGDRDHAAIR